MTGFIDVFGGPNVNPTQLSYTSILANGSRATLQWNLPGDQNIQPGGAFIYPAASKIDIVGFFSGGVVMPDATLVTPGQDILFNNVTGADAIIYADDGVTQILSMPAGTAWFVYLTDNSTANGTWRTVHYGAATSTADASALAGAGLFAAANTLNQKALWSTKNAAYAVTAADRATALANIGGALAFTFAASSVLTNGWFAFFRNNGTGTLTLTAAGGETIDGAATKGLAPGESCIVIADGVTGLDSIGYGRLPTSSITAAIVSIAGTGTTTLNATQIAAAVQTFTGALTGNRIIEYGTGVGYWFVFNTTSGAFSSTFRVNGADPGVVVVQGNYAILRSDGTTMSLAFSATSGTVTNIATGAGLTGGPITNTGTIAMANSGAVAGTYGSTSTVAQIVVDVLGRITSATSLTIAAAWAAITGIPDAITALGSLTPAADKLSYFTGTTTASLTSLTAYARTLLAAASAAAARVLITPLTTNGDFWTYTAGVDARLAVGATGTFIASNGTLPGYRVLAASDIPVGLIPRSHIAGLTLSAAGGSATFGIAAGQAADSTNVSLMNLAAAYTKTTASWALGTGNGSLDTGAIAPSTWYHAYEMQRPDTGVVDVITSLSANAPTLPANYTLFRRIGSMKTDGASQWMKFIQNGSYFAWAATVLDVDDTNPGTGAVSKILASVPTGVIVQAILNSFPIFTSNGNALLLWSDLAVNDEAPSTSVAPLNTGAADTLALGYAIAVGRIVIRTNTSAQVRYRLSASGASDFVRAATVGWIDDRGANA